MYEKPAPQILLSWTALSVAAALPVTGLGAWLLSRYWPTLLGAAGAVWGGALLLFLVVYLPLRRRCMRFALEPGHVMVTGGVFFPTTRRMRLDAVRQITLLQGPLERLGRTAFLLVSGTGGHLLIEGIRYRQAEAWCRRLQPE